MMAISLYFLAIGNCGLRFHVENLKDSESEVASWSEGALVPFGCYPIQACAYSAFARFSSTFFGTTFAANTNSKPAAVPPTLAATATCSSVAHLPAGLLSFLIDGRFWLGLPRWDLLDIGSFSSWPYPNFANYSKSSSLSSVRSRAPCSFSCHPSCWRPASFGCLLTSC